MGNTNTHAAMNSSPSSSSSATVTALSRGWKGELGLSANSHSTDPQALQNDPDDLVIQTWAFCKAKPAPALVYRSDAEERQRRESRKWRERASFVELDCGEDSFFVSRDQKTIGVADGVGGWRSMGVDPSEFSNALMAHAKQYVDSRAQHSTEPADPQKTMAVAHKKVVEEKKVKAGSSTACIATLRRLSDGSHELDVANLGDSGLLVVRQRKPYFRAHELTHAFNTPFQLAVVPKYLVGRSISDTAQRAVRERVKVQEGDVIVMGTDGLFDNRFEEQLAEDAGWIGFQSTDSGSASSFLQGKLNRSAGDNNQSKATLASSGNGTNSSSMQAANQAFLSNIPVVGRWLSYNMSNEPISFTDPYKVAQRLVMDASRSSLSSTTMTPWSATLRQHGAPHALGGKSDDITVILGRIGKRGMNGTNIPSW